MTNRVGQFAHHRQRFAGWANPLATLPDPWYTSSMVKRLFKIAIVLVALVQILAELGSIFSEYVVRCCTREIESLERWAFEYERKKTYEYHHKRTGGGPDSRT